MLHRSLPFLKGLRLLHSGGQAHFENIDRGIYIPIMSRLAFRTIIVPIVVVSSVVPFECYLTNISFIVAVLEKDIGPGSRLHLPPLCLWNVIVIRFSFVFQLVLPGDVTDLNLCLGFM